MDMLREPTAADLASDSNIAEIIAAIGEYHVAVALNQPYRLLDVPPYPDRIEASMQRLRDALTVTGLWLHTYNDGQHRVLPWFVHRRVSVGHQMLILPTPLPISYAEGVKLAARLGAYPHPSMWGPIHYWD